MQPRPNGRRPARPVAARAPATDGSGSRRHVLIVVQNLPVPLDRRVWLECQSLAEAGFRVSVICPKGPGDPPFQVLDGIRLHKYDPPAAARSPLGFVREFAYCWLQTARLAACVAARERVDAIQACNPPDTYFSLAAMFKLTGARFVFDQHDLCPELYGVRFPEGPGHLLAALRALERATYRLADHVIATNESFREVALGRGGLAPDAVSVVRSGPVAARMRRGYPHSGLRNGCRYLGCYLGVMGPQDGVDLLLRAVAHLVHERGRRDCHFALLGFGDCFEDLRRLAGELDLTQWVTFTGRADDELISAYLSSADVGLAPDPKNGFNDLCSMNKVVEYMAFGLPVVSFDLKETRFSAGEAGVYVDDNDPAAFALALDLLLDDPARRQRMGELARARIETQLSWEHQAATYVELYRRLLGVPAGQGTIPLPTAHVARRPARRQVSADAPPLCPPRPTAPMRRLPRFGRAPRATAP
ncbi:MAG: glycosyltransferase family 4 protein, partial [Actinomycetota bacterium]|nr:glycosyltransferase family 4 protein [Actinomycetota bacterium]